MKYLTFDDLYDATTTEEEKRRIEREVEEIGKKVKVPNINICLTTSPDQFCACCLDEHFFRPVLEQGEDAVQRLKTVLIGYLKLHKKEPYVTPVQEQGFRDELAYYTGEAYQRNELTIYDVLWNINLPHSAEIPKEQIETIENTLGKLLSQALDELGVAYKFIGFDKVN